MKPDRALAFERCVRSGGVAIFPADTVYGIACEADNDVGARRLALIKDRDAKKPMAIMFFSRERALKDLDWLGDRTRDALSKLVPGPVTVVIPGGKRFRLATFEGRLGVRVPRFEGELAPLVGVDCVVMQTSANTAGGPDARSVDQIPPEIRQAVNLQVDGGELPGIASTVVDLSHYEFDGDWEILREGAVPADEISALLG